MSQHKDPVKPTSTMECRMVFQWSFRASSFVQQISNAAPSAVFLFATAQDTHLHRAF